MQESRGKLVKVGRKSIRKYKNGTYYIRRWCTYEDESGHLTERWSPTRTIHGKKQDADNAVELYKVELEKELGIYPEETTLAEYADDYQAARKKKASRPDSGLKMRTVERDELEIGRIKQYFGKYTIRELTAGVILDKIETMRDDNYTQNIIHNSIGKLSNIIEYALGKLARNNNSLLLSNPCNLKVIKDEIKRPKAAKQNALTLNEARSLANAIKNEPKTSTTVAIWIALFTGMRKGEVLGLTWDNIDLDECVIHVRKQYTSKREIQTPKTEESNRDVPIDATTSQFLKRWKQEQAQSLSLLGVAQAQNSPVINNEIGDYLDPAKFDMRRREYFASHELGKFSEVREYRDRNGIKRYKKTGYTGYTFHELRHTQVTLLLGEGQDVKTVQGRVGHTDASLTLNTYAHTITEKQREAANTIGELLTANS